MGSVHNHHMTSVEGGKYCPQRTCSRLRSQLDRLAVAHQSCCLNTVPCGALRSIAEPRQDYESIKFIRAAAVPHGNKFETDWVNIPHIKALEEGRRPRAATSGRTVSSWAPCRRIWAPGRERCRCREPKAKSFHAFSCIFMHFDVFSFFFFKCIC